MYILNIKVTQKCCKTTWLRDWGKEELLVGISLINGNTLAWTAQGIDARMCAPHMAEELLAPDRCHLACHRLRLDMKAEKVTTYDAICLCFIHLPGALRQSVAQSQLAYRPIDKSACHFHQSDCVPVTFCLRCSSSTHTDSHCCTWHENTWKASRLRSVSMATCLQIYINLHDWLINGLIE